MKFEFFWSVKQNLNKVKMTITDLILTSLMVWFITENGGDTHSTAHIDGKNSDLGESGAENMGGSNEGYPSSQSPPLGSSKTNGNNAPPPAPTIPPPPLDDDPPVYTNGSGRPVKDSPV